MPDWTKWLTEEEQVRLADVNEIHAHHWFEESYCTVAALRALVEKLQERGRKLADHVHHEYDANCVEADRMLFALALTEDEMRKRLEEK